MVYVFLADGFEECEALAPADILRRGGIDLKTVGVTGKTVTGAHGIPVICDITADATTFVPGKGEVEDTSNMRVIVVDTNDDIRAISLELY